VEGRGSSETVAMTVESLLPEFGAVAEATPVPKGHGHECWRVATASATVMLKLALRSATAVSMANLAEALRLAHLGAVPAPRLLWSGEPPTNLGGRPMLIQEFLSGIDGEDALTELNRDARAMYFRDWGVAVGRMHSVRPPCFSTSISEPSRCHTTWSAVVEERLETMTALNRDARVLPQQRLDEASEQILSGAKKVSPLVSPGLIHNDLYATNTLLDGGRFIAILDFEHAKAWDPVHDFVKLRMWTFERYEASEVAFLDGYRSTAPIAESFEARLGVCLGLELLAGFPYWKRHGEDAMLEDYLRRFDSWLGAHSDDVWMCGPDPEQP
jgi:aminoglycoside phosphotransferase (APT) family kinase protein